MFKFLMFLLLIGLFGFLVIGVLLGRAIRFFGPEDKTKNQRKKNNKSQHSNATNTVQKKFSKNEGEYIPYEEVKDEE